VNKLIPVVWILLLSACVSAPKYGFGPVQLTPDQQKFYDKYLNRISLRKDKKEAWAFAISPTQNYARYIYKSGGRHTRAQEKAINLCNDGVKIKDCKIYDTNGKVVWKFDEMGNN
jgi:hypothetical protein